MTWRNRKGWGRPKVYDHNGMPIGEATELPEGQASPEVGKEEVVMVEEQPTKERYKEEQIKVPPRGYVGRVEKKRPESWLGRKARALKKNLGPRTRRERVGRGNLLQRGADFINNEIRGGIEEANEELGISKKLKKAGGDLKKAGMKVKGTARAVQKGARRISLGDTEAQQALQGFTGSRRPAPAYPDEYEYYRRGGGRRMRARSRRQPLINITPAWMQAMSMAEPGTNRVAMHIPGRDSPDYIAPIARGTGNNARMGPPDIGPPPAPAFMQAMGMGRGMGGEQRRGPPARKRGPLPRGFRW